MEMSGDRDRMGWAWGGDERRKRWDGVGMGW
jgi:hypothetical protein